MFRKNLIPLLIGILVLSGMLLMGQGTCTLAPVPKTGQTTVYARGDDGYLQMGVAWPEPRFIDNGDGTVTDELTSLLWTQDASCAGSKTWEDALVYCNTLADGTCGLKDGSSAGDWRLANIRELMSLGDYGNTDPALPKGHPFTNLQYGATNVQSVSSYWSSTTSANDPSNAWIMDFAKYHGADFKGSAFGDPAKSTGNNYVWCVRY